MSIIRKEQLTNPLSASYALTASYAENISTIDLSKYVTTSSFNAFTSSINAFTSSYNTGSFSGSFTGSLNGTASWAEYVVNGGNINTSSFATTGSNVFIGNQTISGSAISFSSSLLITNPDDQQWGIGLNNRSFTPIVSSNGPHLGIWVQNDGQAHLGTEYGQVLNIYSTTDNQYSLPAIKVTGSNALITGSLFGTSSWAYNVVNEPNIDTSSFATTGSNIFVGNQTITGSINFGDGSLIQSISASSGDGGGYTTLTLKPNTSVVSDQYIVLDPTTPNHIHIRAGGTIDSSSAYLYLGGEKANVVVRNLDDSFREKYWVQINSQTGSTQNTWIFDDNGVLSAPGEINAPSFSGSFTGSFNGTASWAENAQTASYIDNLNQNLTLSGSLTITQNLTVLGSQSIQYITSSQLDISTNLITVNTSTPAVRFGGLAVRDSGSFATGLTGSLLWDSQNNVWIYSNPSGAAYDGGLLLTGPRNTSGLGNEVGINSWYAALGDGSHHMTSSQIYNSGSLIRLETNTQVTGSLNISAGITGSLHGTSSWADNSTTASYILSSNVYGPNGFNSVNYAQNANYASIILSPLGQNLAIHGLLDNFLNFNDFDSLIRTPNSFTGHYIGGDIIDTFPSPQPTELIYLELSDNRWYLVDQTSHSSTKMLGVCVVDNDNIKRILLEGYVVLLETSITGDKEEGLPVFISGSGTYTTKPQDFISGYIRSVGYLHSGYFDGLETYWLLKFKPSNDWMRIA